MSQTIYPTAFPNYRNCNQNTDDAFGGGMCQVPNSFYPLQAPPDSLYAMLRRSVIGVAYEIGCETGLMAQQNG